MGLMPEEQKIAEEIDKEFSQELLKEENTVEALLFTMGRSVSIDEIAVALDVGKEPALDAVERLRSKYMERQGGILIERYEDRYQMCTNPLEFEGLIRVVKQPKKPVLTDVVMETLAIIAYKQPITKAEIERIRGVKSDHAVNRLVEYDLVYEAGRLDAPGRPALFATTEEFLHRFNVNSIQDLPELTDEVEAAIESEVTEEIADVLGSDEEENPEFSREDKKEDIHADVLEASKEIFKERKSTAEQGHNDIVKAVNLGHELKAVEKTVNIKPELSDIEEPSDEGQKLSADEEPSDIKQESDVVEKPGDQEQDLAVEEKTTEAVSKIDDEEAEIAEQAFSDIEEPVDSIKKFEDADASADTELDFAAAETPTDESENLGQIQDHEDTSENISDEEDDEEWLDRMIYEAAMGEDTKEEFQDNDQSKEQQEIKEDIEENTSFIKDGEEEIADKVENTDEAEEDIEDSVFETVESIHEESENTEDANAGAPEI